MASYLHNIFLPDITPILLKLCFCFYFFKVILNSSFCVLYEIKPIQLICFDTNILGQVLVPFLSFALFLDCHLKVIQMFILSRSASVLVLALVSFASQDLEVRHSFQNLMSWSSQPIKNLL